MLVDNHPVITPRIVGCNHSIKQIIEHTLWVPLARVTAMTSVTGTVTRFMHIWPYRSLDERMRLRAKAVDDGVWPPPGGPGYLASQQSDIYLPAPFSPLQ